MNKKQTISAINEIIEKYEGSLHSSDFDEPFSPVYKSVGKDHAQTIERFATDYCNVTEYIHENEVGETSVYYDDLSEELLDEIYIELEQFDIGIEKTMNKCKD